MKQIKIFIKPTKFNLFCLLTCVCLLAFTLGCKKLIEIDSPSGELVGKDAYSSNTNSIAVVTGMYGDLGNASFFQGRNSVSVFTSLASDELITVSTPTDILGQFFRNALVSEDGGLWASLYTYIYRANSAIEGISASSGVTERVKNQLLGEAKFVRALMYYYLVNLYGNVPLLTTTDVKVNSNAPRIDRQIVNQQIVNDLNEAIVSLSANYVANDVVSNSNERIRPNRFAATALLARVHLSMGKWEDAEREASEVIGNSALYKLEEDLNSIFLNTSREAIWQIQPTVIDQNTLDGSLFNLKAGPLGFPVSGPNADSRPVYLNEKLYNSFQNIDLRKSNWIDTSMVYDNTNGQLIGTYPFANKYKIGFPGFPKTEYLMVIRLAEVYLIRAEARARLGKSIGSNSAISDINAIRHRAGLDDFSFQSADGLFTELLDQRRKELFTEFGHRWFDLKRFDKLNQIMSVEAPLKGGTWSPYKGLLPIPIVEFRRNPQMRGNQNPGYPEQ